MSELLELAIDKVKHSKMALCKFITPNDAGLTGGHQCGFHISKHGWSMFLDEEGIKGQNKEKFVKVKWQDDFETDSRFIYYERRYNI